MRENVEFYAGLYGLSDAELERSWGALRERFSLGEAEAEKTEDLPAGIRQRAGLALSILHQPRVVFLDEPTAGVDVHNRGLFWELIQDEAQAGVTVFVTTHFLEEVDYCDWVCFIDAGRLIANAAPEALRQRYSYGYRIDVDVAADARGDAAALLGTSGRRVDDTGTGIQLSVPALDPDVLALLGPLRGRPSTGARAHRAGADDRRLPSRTRGVWGGAMNWRRLRTLMRREVLATFRDPFTVTILITVPLVALLALRLRPVDRSQRVVARRSRQQPHQRQPPPGGGVERQRHL